VKEVDPGRRAEHWSIEPDAQVLAFDTTHESKRADLQELPMPG
jgi:hypothetical protein